VLVLDTNVLFDAAVDSSEFHAPCRQRLDQWRRERSQILLTWNVCYEFLRITTHPRAVLREPWTSRRACGFLRTLLSEPGFALLAATPRHAAVLAQTLEEVPEARGNLIYDVHTTVLMREHGIRRICTRDADFQRFPFLEIVDPLQGKLCRESAARRSAARYNSPAFNPVQRGGKAASRGVPRLTD
jgi:toxin-antitoxin system PIN domain toxin